MVVPFASRIASLGVMLPLAACGFDSPEASTDDGTDPGQELTVVPSNGLEPRALTDGDAELDTAVTGALVIDTATGAIRRTGGEVVRAPGEGYDEASKIHFRVVAQPGAPAIGVFSFASLRVAAGGPIRARGGNALALAAEGLIAIDGLLDLTGGPGACEGDAGGSAPARCAGPGGSTGGAHEAMAAGPGGGGSGSGGPVGVAESGGGGGGHLTAGGIGGRGLNSPRGTAGAAFGSMSLEPLTGGGGGGGGGDEPQTGMPGAAGGGGGGAVQIVSSTAIRIGTGPGTGCGINAGGGGAGRSFDSSAGGGGGAGGGILLEAPEVALGGGCWLAANGGGGSGAHNAVAGTTGQLSAAAAAGSIEGSSGMRRSGDGGAGGATAAPQQGEDADDEAGGGGGGGGVTRVNTQDARRFSRAGMICPSFTEGAVRLE